MQSGSRAGRHSFSTDFQMLFAMPLRNLFKSDPVRDAAHDLYLAVVEQARQPGFYMHAGVPDSTEARFDMVVLHAFLAIHRLKADDGHPKAVAQHLYNVMFDDMDRSLREMGVGDFGIGHKVNRLSKAFFGRIQAYETAIAEADDAALREALGRNLYGTVAPSSTDLATMAAYVRQSIARLRDQPTDAVVGGKLRFGDVPDGSPSSPPADEAD